MGLSSPAARVEPGLSSQEDPPVTCLTPTHLPCACSRCRLVPDKNLVAKKKKKIWWGGEFTLGEQ